MKLRIGILLALPLCVYLWALNAPFISDDIPSIVTYPLLGTWKFIAIKPHAFIQPLLYNIIFTIGGHNPLLFRLPNLLQHMANVLLVFAILKTMKDQKVAFYTAAIFAVHPTLTESVTWISGGNYSRYAFFFLLSFFFYILAKKDKRMYVFSLLTFLLCLFSTEKALALPFVFALYEFVFNKPARNYRATLPFFALTALFVVVYILQLSARLEGLSLINYAQEQAIYSYNPLLQIPVAITSYLQLIIWPDALTVYHTELYSYTNVFFRSVVLAAFVLSIVYSYKRSKLIFFWLCFFLITLIPTLLPLGIASSMAERYVYLGSVGIFLCIGYAFSYLEKRSHQEQLIQIIFILVILLLGARTIVRNNDYKSFENFWLSTVRVSPLSYQARNNVGIIYAQQGNYEGALSEFKKSLEIVPNSFQSYQNIAGIYFAQKKYDEALAYYEKTVELNPAVIVAHQNMAGIYFAQEKTDKALESTEKALLLSPNNTQLMTNLGLIYLRQGKKQKAREAFSKVLTFDPQNQQARAGYKQAQ